MSDRPVAPLARGRPAGPIDEIARADAERRNATQNATTSVGSASDPGPDLQPASRPFAPQGHARIVDQALGRVQLPRLIELAGALEEARRAARIAADIDPALAEVIDAVLDDEGYKVARYLTASAG